MQTGPKSVVEPAPASLNGLLREVEVPCQNCHIHSCMGRGRVFACRSAVTLLGVYSGVSTTVQFAKSDSSANIFPKPYTL